MPVVFALEGRPKLADDDALGIAELLADHQDPAALGAATAIRAAVIGGDEKLQRPIRLDHREKVFLCQLLNAQRLLASNGIAQLKAAVTRELGRGD